MQFVDLQRQQEAIRDDLARRMDRALRSAKFILGPEVQELEHELAAFCGASHCIGVANGTDALQLCLRALDIGPGDAVFVPSFTFVASAEVVSQVGAQPIFVDVDERTFNINADSLATAAERVVAEGRLLPRAVIAVDLFGLCADYDAIAPVAERFQLTTIEDAAQSFGAASKGRGACTLADIATTSFFPAKPLGCYGDGGAVFTDSSEMADKIRSLRVHGKGTNKYDNVRVGLNSRLDTLQAAVLLSKLTVFSGELVRRQETADYYARALSGPFAMPFVPADERSAWAQYTLNVADGRRDALQAHLRALDIPSVVYYPLPLHCQPVYREMVGEDAECPVSERLSASVLSIPVHPYLEDSERHSIVDAVNSFAS